MKSFAILFFAAALGWSADFTTGQAARLIIGQPNPTAQQDGASSSQVGAPSGIAIGGGTFVLADDNRVGAFPNNNRVLIYPPAGNWLPQPSDPPAQGTRCPICVGDASIVLGQPDFSTTNFIAPTQSSLRQPTAVATDGTMLAVADTDNNRILIWKNIPSSNGAPADYVLGQPNFTSNRVVGSGTSTPNATSLRGPQGVWIDNGRLFVADTQNHRVLIWTRSISQNGQAADIVVGQQNFTAHVEPDLTKTNLETDASNLLNPVSVTTDPMGRMFVADLGHNRVLIWKNIPTSNNPPADFEIGQPDMTHAFANYVLDDSNGDGKVDDPTGLCPSNGTDSDGNPTYPSLCATTLNFPRYALSDGTRLFVADGGNDRVLIFNSIPQANAAAADIVLGQPNFEINQNSDAANPLYRSSTDSVRTPSSLAWDGTNLFVSDPYNRRVLVFTPGDILLGYTAIRNAASPEIYAVGGVGITGTINPKDKLTITIGGKDYVYTVVSGDTLDTVIDHFVSLINAGDGDPNAFAYANHVIGGVQLTARNSGEGGNSVSLGTATSTSAQITLTASGATLAGGGDAAKIAPGTIVSLLGDNLTDQTLQSPGSANPLPTELGGVEVFFDGIQAGLLSVSPEMINAQIPYEVSDATSSTAFVRSRFTDGTLRVSTATGVPIVPQNPGIFTQPDYTGNEPKPGLVLHGSSFSTGTVYVEGAPLPGDIINVTIGDHSYSYTVVDGDTKASVRDALIALINADPDVPFVASRGGVFNRVRLVAKIPGPDYDNILISASSPETGGAAVGTFNGVTCCASQAGAPVTAASPARPGETILIYATGLGLVTPDDARQAQRSGYEYDGPVYNQPNADVSSMAGGKTANVIAAGMQPGTYLFQVQLELNSDIPTNPSTQLTIAQDIYVSNIVTFPVVNPNPAP
ncbi:MAG: hypothetical protein IT160_03090 [Bryobacterales bacterium]|nr:hypothetical protein [Bryobacterales bacterium]